MCLCVCSNGGSSPHTRGAPKDTFSGLDSARIIPAYAGSTWKCDAAHTGGADHPRIRGEHLKPAFLRLHIAGSSPHTRGALLLRHPRLFLVGIIPAYAGSTPSTRLT